MNKILLALFVFAIGVPLEAQWVNQKTAGIPRTADGKPDLSAPAPRTKEGNADIAGLWQVNGIYIGDIAKDLKPAEVPFQPWAAELYKHRRETESKEDPTGYCIPGGVPRSDAVPYPFKIFTTPGVAVILYEAVHSYRQIFTDGREIPKDAQPTWMGYSIGHWEKNGLVVETAGFNNQGWIDNWGKPATDALHVTERFERRDFGHMDLKITVDDPKAYTKPWSVTLPVVLQPDDELIEYICGENNKDIGHLVGK